MKHLLFQLSIVILCCCPFMLLSQEDNRSFELCGFKAPENRESDNSFSRSIVQCMPNGVSAVNIPVQFTVIRHSTQCDNDRFEMTKAILEKAINDINTAGYFKKYNFINEFKIVGIKYINDDDASINIPDASLPTTSLQSSYEKLYDLTPQNTAVQICIVNTPRSFALIPNNFPTYKPNNKYYYNNMIVLSEKKVNMASVNTFKMELSHELGHYFDLWHTHENTEPNPKNANSAPNNPEFADGTDSNKRGDLLVDTPADPRADLCTYTQCGGQCNEFDLNPTNQQRYKPDMFNIMGYYYPTNRCGGTNNVNNIPFGFSDCQFDKMIKGLNSQRRSFLKTAPIPSLINVTDFHAGEFRIARCDKTTPYEAMFMLKDVTIDFDNSNTRWKTLTDCNRYIGTNNTSSTGVHQILPLKDDYPIYKDKVTAADIVALQKHILAIDPLKTAYQKIAGDVNNDGSLSTSDIVEIRKLILGLIPKFTRVPSWRFLSLTHEKAMSTNVLHFADSNPFTQSYNGKPYLRNATNPSYLDHVDIDYGNNATAYDPLHWSFKGIKMGDVNCNAAIALKDDPESWVFTNVVEVDTNVNNRIIGTMLYEVEVLLKNQTAIEAYQLGFDYPKDKFELVGVRRGDDPNLDLERNFNIGEPGKVKMLWYQEGEQGLNQQQEKTNLFRLLFAPKGDVGNLKEILSLDKESFYSAFYSRELAETKTFLTLKVSRISQGGSTPTIKTIKSDKVNIYPNPTDGSIYCNIPLSTNSPIVITLSDMYGKVVYEQKMFGTVGTNEIEINNLAQYQSNILYYSVKTDEGVMTGKIVIR